MNEEIAIRLYNIVIILSYHPYIIKLCLLSRVLYSGVRDGDVIVMWELNGDIELKLHMDG